MARRVGKFRKTANSLLDPGARLALSGSNVDKLEAFRSSLGGDHVDTEGDRGAEREQQPDPVDAVGVIGAHDQERAGQRRGYLFRVEER